MKKFGIVGGILGKGYYNTARTENEHEWAQGSGVFWMHGVQIVDVAVDPENGKIEAERIIAAHDVGKAINPLTVKQQIEGGVIMALGTSLYEELKFDNYGRLINNSFHDYKLPTALDTHRITPLIIEIEHPLGPFGAKGLGEPVVTGIAPAIGNEIHDATGIRFTSLPITAEKVINYLRQNHTF